MTSNVCTDLCAWICICTKQILLKLCNSIHIPLTTLFPTCLLSSLQFVGQQPPREICKCKNKQCLRGHHRAFGPQFNRMKLTKTKGKLKKTQPCGIYKLQFYLYIYGNYLTEFQVLLTQVQRRGQKKLLLTLHRIIKTLVCSFVQSEHFSIKFFVLCTQCMTNSGNDREIKVGSQAAYQTNIFLKHFPEFP